MASKPRQIPGKLVEQEGKIQLAISALKKDGISSIRRAVEIFNVPRSTLQDRLNGCQYQIEKRSHNRHLLRRKNH
jgi:predicted HTH domain antitoxin